MNLDRVENQTHVRRRFPRYHNTLFRGQALWDPYTHVILPPAALVPQRQQQHNWKEKERTEKERENRRTNGIKGLKSLSGWNSHSLLGFSLDPSERCSGTRQYLSQSDRRIHCSQTHRIDARAAHHHRHLADLSQSGRCPPSQVPHRQARSEVGINHSQNDKKSNYSSSEPSKEGSMLDTEIWITHVSFIQEQTLNQKCFFYNRGNIMLKISVVIFNFNQKLARMGKKTEKMPWRHLQISYLSDQRPKISIWMIWNRQKINKSSYFKNLEQEIAVNSFSVTFCHSSVFSLMVSLPLFPPPLCSHPSPPLLFLTSPLGSITK